MAFYWIQSAYNLSDMLSKHWDHPAVYPMILKVLITRGNITLIPREATQEQEKEILNQQPEKLKDNEKENKGHPMYTWCTRNYLLMCCSCRPNYIYQN